jgi:hypothetical protein
MNTDGHERITSRKARPIHYIAPAVLLLIFGVLIATFGLQIAIRFMMTVIIVVCALVGLYSLRFAVFAYRLKFVRTSFGRIERDKKPALFWMLFLFAVLTGPLLISLSVMIMRWW